MDGLVFASNDFCSTVPSPTTYERNFEEAVGNRTDIEGEKSISILAIDSVNNEITIGGSVDPYFQISIHEKITIDDDTTKYTVSDINIVGSDTKIKVIETLPSSGSKLKYSIFNKDHFIALDREGTLGSSGGSLGVSSSPMRTIVNNFQSEIDNIVNNSSAKTNLIGAVNTYAPQILQRAQLYVQQKDGSDYKHPDDRLLYWARIKMEVVLKSHPFLLQSTVDRTELVKLFEEKSRGYTTVDFNSTEATNADIKLLVTGFDPFPTDRWPLQGNPSAACSMSFHGKTFDTGTKTVFIQAMIVPVRYRDFDGDDTEHDKNGGTGIVEDYIAPLIGGGVGKADMIITMSQSGIGNYNIDRFGTINRGGYNDNLGKNRPKNSNSTYLNATERDNHWDHLETTLPKHMAQVLGDLNDPVPDVQGHSTVYAQHYVPKEGFDNVIPECPITN